MKSINKLVFNISKVIEIALQECCLPLTQTYYDSISDLLVVHHVSQFVVENGKPRKIEIETKIKNKKWKTEIWTTDESGCVKLKTTQLTKLIDNLMAIKKKVS